MFEKIKEMLAQEFDIAEETITMDSSFRDDLGIDSLDLYEMILALEEDYDFEIPTEDMGTLDTVGSVVKYFDEHGIQA